MPPIKSKLVAVLYVACLTLAWIGVGVFFLWSAGAIFYATFLPSWVRVPCSMLYFFGAIVLFFRVGRQEHWLSMIAVSIILIYLLTLIQQPSNERNWDPSQAETTRIDFQDEHVTIRGFRHCEYRTELDYDVHYSDFEFDLQDVTAVWFLVHKFSPMEGLAHTFISFEVATEDQPIFFGVSVEVRREIGQVYSPIRGLYRQFELLYVIGDERDLIGVRTVMRKDDRVHLYRVNASEVQAQQLFVDVAQRVNRLSRRPEFYHTFLNNCTNGIVFHTYQLTPEPINWLDPRIVFPGFSDRYAHAEGLIGSPGVSFEDQHRAARIDPIAREVGLADEAFSLKIRAQLGEESDAPVDETPEDR